MLSVNFRPRNALQRKTMILELQWQTIGHSISQSWKGTVAKWQYAVFW